jgi:hypothetical protein
VARLCCSARRATYKNHRPSVFISIRMPWSVLPEALKTRPANDPGPEQTFRGGHFGLWPAAETRS